MTLPRFLAVAFIITCFCLLYVWQQTEVFRLAYDGQKNLANFEDLLDVNSNLRYNLKRNTSLVRIASKVTPNGDFQIPENYCLVKVAASKKRLTIAGNSLPKNKSFISRILDPKRLAEAKTVTSSNTFRMDGQ